MTELCEFSASTVLVGRFNPLIFSPDWLHANGMIGPDEAATAREHGVEILAPNIASIKIGSMKLIVEEERFFLTVSDEPLIRAKDLPSVGFKLLSHTPVWAVGLNLNAKLVADDIERWHRFGDRLAPKEPWGDFVTNADGDRLGGLRGIVMERTGAPGDYAGHARCSIQVPEKGERVAVLQMNNHFDIGSAQSPSNGAEALQLIETLWDDVMVESRRVLNHIREIADAA